MYMICVAWFRNVVQQVQKGFESCTVANKGVVNLTVNQSIALSSLAGAVTALEGTSKTYAKDNAMFERPLGTVTVCVCVCVCVCVHTHDTKISMMLVSSVLIPQQLRFKPDYPRVFWNVA